MSDRSKRKPDKDVVLSFPNKELILLNAQDDPKENIYLDPVSDKESVERYLENRTFCGTEKYTADGALECARIIENDNLLIKGDNLPVLSTISEEYGGQVRMIYWDVP